MLKVAAAVMCTVSIGAGNYQPSASAAAHCEALVAMRLSNVTINVATPVTGGSFTPDGAQQAITGLPDFCRISGVIKPTSTSEIVFLDLAAAREVGTGDSNDAANFTCRER